MWVDERPRPPGPFQAGAITIRGIPEETGEELAARAALTGRSLQEYLRAQLIELARRPDPEALVARIRARIATDSILDKRDAGRR